jgi:very-short-patch-repair endonuclease
VKLNTTEFAKALRRNQTEAEAKLWSRLRNRQLENRKFRRQFSIGTYVADFVCIEAKLVVELDGGQHADAATYDMRRTQELEASGFFVLGFWNGDVLRDIEAVVATIHSVIVPDEYAT